MFKVFLVYALYYTLQVAPLCYLLSIYKVSWWLNILVCVVYFQLVGKVTILLREVFDLFVDELEDY